MFKMLKNYFRRCTRCRLFCLRAHFTEYKSLPYCSRCIEDTEQVRICADCEGLIEYVGAGDEGWSVCRECRNVEQKTFCISEEEWEALG